MKGLLSRRYSKSAIYMYWYICEHHSIPFSRSEEANFNKCGFYVIALLFIFHIWMIILHAIFLYYGKLLLILLFFIMNANIYINFWLYEPHGCMNAVGRIIVMFNTLFSLSLPYNQDNSNKNTYSYLNGIMVLSICVCKVGFKFKCMYELCAYILWFRRYISICVKSFVSFYFCSIFVCSSSQYSTCENIE